MHLAHFCSSSQAKDINIVPLAARQEIFGKTENESCRVCDENLPKKSRLSICNEFLYTTQNLLRITFF